MRKEEKEAKFACCTQCKQQLVSSCPVCGKIVKIANDMTFETHMHLTCASGTRVEEKSCAGSKRPFKQ